MAKNEVACRKPINLLQSTPVKWLLTKTLGGDNTGNYLRWVGSVGVTPDLADDASGDLGAYDALLLTGGVDVNPSRYGAPPHPETLDIQDARDELELTLIRRFLELRRPVFGVCRGIQVLNVALGGRLIQHVPDVLGDRELHRQSGKSDARHPIRFTEQSRLATALKGVDAVNSAHHQAIDPAGLAGGLRVTAHSGGGIIEAVEEVGLPSPVVAVQWHPERLDPADPASERLLHLMVTLCGNGIRSDSHASA